MNQNQNKNPLTTIQMNVSRFTEKAVAVGSFLAATALAFTSLLISADHDIAAGSCMVIAQFLLLTASIFGIDYKLNSYGATYPRHPQQQPS